MSVELTAVFQLLGAGRWSEGEAQLVKILRRRPDLGDGWFGLGVARFQLGRLPAAAAAFRRALALAPDVAALWSNLAMTGLEGGSTAAAEVRFERALRLAPDFVDALANLGVVRARAKNWTSARRLLQGAAALVPVLPQAWTGLADLAIGERAAMTEAVIAFTRARRLGILPYPARSSLIYALQFLETVPAIAKDAAAREFGQTLSAELKAPRVSYKVRRDPARRLRIGYLSADFRQHSCAYFLTPLFAEHDRTAVEVIAIADAGQPDAMTARLRGLADRWVDITGQPDRAVAERVRHEKIDILIDLAGHTAGNRLPVFAYKPAPVQLSWLGYSATTGLAEIDGRISDDWLTPASLTEWFSETVIRLPRVAHCYRPPDGLPDVAPAPAQTNGAITFGCFNGLGKLSDATLTAWAEILRALPGARLVLKARADNVAAVRTRFASRGGDAERLTFAPWAHDQATQFGQHALFDLGLDPWPYNGTTTTCEAMWMGVPTLTLVGERMIGRVGASLNHAVGLEEFIARDAAGYVAKAIAYGRDVSRLSNLRRDLRARMAASPLRDERGFAGAMEALYRAAWQRWYAGA